MERSFRILFAGALALLAPRLRGATWCVAPGGSDTAAGSVAAPYRTLAKAMAAAQPGDTVLLRQGAYRETLTAVRAGTAAAPITVQGYPGESAVLCGSNLVTGAWTLHSGKIWRIDGLPATRAVYVDGLHMPEARWPNVPVGAAMTAGWATADAGTNGTTLVDAALPAGALDGARVRIIPGSAWVAYSRTVTGYGGGQFGFDSSVGPNSAYWPKAGNLYYLYRSLALLDAAGEWYQDPVTRRLYLWLPDGGSPAAHTVEIASRKAVASVQGYGYIRLKDLFTFSGWIDFNGCAGGKVLNVHQRYVHENWDVDGYNYEPTLNEMAGGSGGEWADGSIEGSTGDGIYISGTGHQVHGMTIRDVDWIATYRGAVRMGGSGHTVSGNTFHDSGRFLIFHDQAKGGSLDHNELYNAGLLTMDLGATYCYRCNGGGMAIAYNHIHDVHCSVGAGIYLDNAGSNFRIHHNLVHDVDWFALKLNLPSYDNIVVNNTLFAKKYWVNAAGSQYPQEMTGTALVNNLYSGGSSLVTGAMGPSLVTNATYASPLLNADWTLAAGSPAIDKGSVDAPWTDGYCGAKPDQGAFEYGCGAAWTAGSGRVPPPFPYPLPSTPATPTRTATRTPAASPTRSPSATATRTPTSTATRSATLTGTRSPSPTATGSPSATLTPAGSPSATGTGSPTASPTVSSSATATPSASASATPTDSASATATPSGTATASPSATLSPSRTPTPSASPTPTPTATPSATGTGSPTASPTISNSATATLTATRTATATNSPSPQPSATASPVVTATPTASPSPRVIGPLEIRAVFPYPNPSRGPLVLRYQSGGAAEAVDLEVFSVAEVKLGRWTLPGPDAEGWHETGVDAGTLGAGLYYVRFSLRDGGRRSEPRVVKVYRLP